MTSQHIPTSLVKDELTMGPGAKLSSFRRREWMLSTSCTKASARADSAVGVVAMLVLLVALVTVRVPSSERAPDAGRSVGAAPVGVLVDVCLLRRRRLKTEGQRSGIARGEG